MSHERVNPPELAAPSGFSHGVLAAGGRTLYIAGQTAQGPDNQIRGATIAEQVEVALGNMLEVLRAAGGGPEHLVRITGYVCNLEDYQANAPEIGAAWRRIMGREYPAMALVEVSRLWSADALIELEGTAVVP